jgi:orotidine-5'-phosphate decarboxylase
VRDHCRLAIEAAGPACVAAKLQLACFERLGRDGWAVLHEVMAAAREAGLLVIADGKRGDVPVTAAAYAEAMTGLGADAFTANPLLGRDSLAPLVDAAGSAGAGCFVLVRTSNPGAADVQDLEVQGAPLWERLARIVDGLGKTGESGLDHVGAVAGATHPEHLARMRELMPRAVFLLPGVGAQGGRVEDLAAAFSTHPAGGLIAASRSIVGAHEERGGDPAQAAAAAAEELRAAAAKL